MERAYGLHRHRLEQAVEHLGQQLLARVREREWPVLRCNCSVLALLGSKGGFRSKDHHRSVEPLRRPLTAPYLLEAAVQRGNIPAVSPPSSVAQTVRPRSRARRTADNVRKLLKARKRHRAPEFLNKRQQSLDGSLIRRSVVLEDKRPMPMHERRRLNKGASDRTAIVKNDLRHKSAASKAPHGHPAPCLRAKRRLLLGARRQTQVRLDIHRL